jgi:hypothetical protein
MLVTRYTRDRFTTLLLVSAVVAGCGGDGGPTDLTPPTVDVSGTWKFRTFDPRVWWTLELTQTGAQLSGRHTSGERQEFNTGFETIPGSGTIVGEVHGDSVLFEMDLELDGDREVFAALASADGMDAVGTNAAPWWDAERAYPPAEPSDVVATALSAHRIELRWEWTEDPRNTGSAFRSKGFLVEGRCCGLPFDQVGEAIPAQVHQIVIDTLLPSAEYTFRVQSGLLERWGGRTFEFLSPFGPEVSATTLDPPQLTALSPASGNVGTTVVIAGARLAPDGATPDVTVGSLLVNRFVASVRDSLLTLRMPNLGSAGDYPVVVLSEHGFSSNALTWTQVGDGDGDEPNDVPGSATPQALPLELVRSLGPTDAQDFFALTLGTTATIVIDLDWDVDADLDVIVQPAATAVPFDASRAAFGNDVCGGTGATNGRPERATCAALSAGTYLVHVIDFDGIVNGDGRLKNYRIVGQ